MTELQTNTCQVSLSGGGSFDFYMDNIIVATEDGYVKFFEVIQAQPGEELERLKVTQTKPVSRNIDGIASNGRDVIAIGGANMKVDTVFREKFDKSTKITETVSSIHRLSYPTMKVILILTKSNGLQIFWVEKSVVTKYNSPHDGKIINGDVDGTSTYIATTGCEGNLFVLKFSDKDPKNTELIHTSKISNQVDFDGNQQLKASWSPNGKILAIPGSKVLKILRKPKLDKIVEVSEISHDGEISQTYWATQHILVTTDVSNNLKVWNFPAKTAAFTMSCEKDIKQVMYSPKLKCLAVLDNDGGLHTGVKDLETAPELLADDDSDVDEQLDDIVSDEGGNSKMSQPENVPM